LYAAGRVATWIAGWIATRVERLGDLFGQYGRGDALVEAFTTLRPPILAGFNEGLARAGQVCDAVPAIRLRHCARIEIIGEQVIDPGGALHAVALRSPVADLRAGVAAGFDCRQRLRLLQIAIEILLVGLQAFDLPGDRSSETALRGKARAILDAFALAGEIPGMTVVLVDALERLDQARSSAASA